VLRQSRDNAEKLKSLQKKLAKAVESEDFEQAAKVRDELKELSPRAAEPAKK
jgi:protein-arginine kinase activator protein McsA